MPTLRRRLVSLLTVAALAATLPAALARAQGAGDDQYQDPFAGTPGSTTPKPKPKPSATTTTPAATSPSSTTAQTTTPSAAGSTPSTVSGSGSGSSTELPRTGLDARPAVLAGVVLLILGLALRRRTRPEHR